MNASNLAVCFAPSLFHLCGAISSSSSSPKQLQRRVPMPSEKDLVEQKVAHECLAYMIANVKSIFTVNICCLRWFIYFFTFTYLGAMHLPMHKIMWYGCATVLLHLLSVKNHLISSSILDRNPECCSCRIDDSISPDYNTQYYARIHKYTWISEIS